MRTSFNIFILSLAFILGGCSRPFESFNIKSKSSVPKKGTNYIEKSATAFKKGKDKLFSLNTSKALLSCPSKYKPNHNKSISLRHKGLFKHAELLNNIAIEKGEDEGINLDTIYYEASQIAAKQKKYNDAFDYLEMIKSPIAYSLYNKGIFSLLTNNYIRTIDILKEKKDQNSLWAVALANFFLNKYDEALRKLDESIDIKSNPEVILTKARVLSSNGQKEEAIKLLRNLTKIKDTKLRAQNYLASLLISSDKLTEAKKILPVLSKNTNYENIVCWGYIYLKESNFDSSYQVFKNANKLNQNGTEAMNGLGYTCLYLNKLEEAEKWFSEVVEISNNNIYALEGLGFVYYESVKYNKSLEYFNAAISVSGYKKISYNALLCTGYLNYYFNKKETAKTILTEAINKSGKNQWSQIYLGFCYYDEGDFEMALSCFKKANHQSPGNMKVINYIGITETRLNMSDEAIKHLNEVLSEDSLNIFALNSLAFSLSDKGKHDDATATMSKVRNLAPDNREYLINSGMLETNYASFFLDKSQNDSVKYHLSKMNEFYFSASIFGYDESALNINRGYGYCMNENYDSALVFYNNVHNTYLEASKINNIAVTNALKNDLSLAKKQFKDALELLEENPEEKNDNLKKSIKKNIEVAESNLSSKEKRKKYSSTIYYFIHLENHKPEFENLYNFEFLDIKNEMPQEVYTDLLYFDDVLCECETKKEIFTRKKSPKYKKHKKHCP